MKADRSRSRRPSALLRLDAGLLALALLAGGCEGDRGSQGPPGPGGSTSPDTELDADEDAPGVNVTVVSLDGASGANGAFQPGDTLSVTYTLETDGGDDWDVADFSRARALVSGPTFNYQRVLAEVSDLSTASVQNADGSFTYTFATPIPATYLPPLNDSASFGAGDGELAGQALFSGTYTLGMYFGWDYTVGDESFRDIGDVTFDFLLGSAATLQPRAVVAQENCNQCHETLQAHGGQRRDVTLCLLCHTAGSEDRNVMTAANGTPGASIDFKVMVHKIHNAKHLPSVLGIGVHPDGTKDYAATPEPYELVGFGNRVIDFSEVAFPVWPSLSFPMPRDVGYSALGSTERGLEDQQRMGVVSCYVCHGDPDGAGPIGAPADGDLAFSQPTRAACGSCHDSIDWSLPYVSNEPPMGMPAQLNDSDCTICHPGSGAALSASVTHVHPLLDPTLNPGLVFELTGVAEAGLHDMDGTLDVGEKVALTFRITDDDGLDVDPADVASLSVAMSGPTDNLNLVNHVALPTAALSGTGPYTLNVPQRVFLELAGTSSSGSLETFGTALTPHWNVSGAETEVWLRSASSTATSLAAAAGASQNYVDVASATGFDRDDVIVLDDGLMGEEYLTIQWVEGNRIWFGSSQQTDYPPGLVFDHAMGAGVLEVTLDPKVEATDYSIDAAMGTVTELVEFGDGDVVVSYTTDMLLPAVYPSTLNDSPDVGDERGDWGGKPLVAGTYKVGLWGYRQIAPVIAGESNSYRAAGESVSVDVLVGDASTIEPYDKISSADNCYACHQDIYFHGGSRRGLESCILCHGTAGSEDRPPYRAPNAPPTTGVEVRFREMLHKIHMGADLANASAYEVIGFGSGFPNNFSVHTYEEVHFPAFPDGTKHCAACHGDGNTAYLMPDPVEHPTDQVSPPQPWGATCGACHDSDAAQAHIDAQTAPSGAESCTVCHEATGELSIGVVHKTR